MGLDKIAKRLGRVLVSQGLMVDSLRMRQWVNIGGEFFHASVCLERVGIGYRTPRPFQSTLVG